MSKVKLKSSHIVIANELAQQLFQNQLAAYLSFNKHTKEALIASIERSWIAKIHDASQVVLKICNINGDKSIAVYRLCHVLE